jgi:hypothetical protein
MALILQNSRCAICDAVLGGARDLVATSAFIADRSDSLWRFSDAPMHRTCFLEWDLREQFVIRFNQTAGSTVFGNGTRHHMDDDGTIVSVPA